MLTPAMLPLNRDNSFTVKHLRLTAPTSRQEHIFTVNPSIYKPRFIPLPKSWQSRFMMHRKVFFMLDSTGIKSECTEGISKTRVPQQTASDALHVIKRTSPV